MKTIDNNYIDEEKSTNILEGKEKNIEKRSIEIAISMLKQNLELNMISAVTGLSLDQILKLKDNA